MKRDVRKTGEEEDWKKKTRDRGGWKRLSDEVVKKLRAAPHPCQREKRKLCVDTIFMIIIMHSFPDIEENLFFDNGGTHLHTHNMHYYNTTF